jgi:hypothetical protein
MMDRRRPVPFLEFGTAACENAQSGISSATRAADLQAGGPMERQWNG